MPGKHAEYSPSSLAALKACPARKRLSRFLPVVESEASKAGTYKHSLGERKINAAITGRKDPDLEKELSTLDPDDRDSITLYADYCLRLRPEEDLVLAAAEVTLRIYGDECWGTADFVAYNFRTRVLDVVDYKSGYAYVPPNTLQLQAYAFGALNALRDLVGVESDEVTMIRTHIVQPANEDQPTRCWEWRRDV